MSLVDHINTKEMGNAQFYAVFVNSIDMYEVCSIAKNFGGFVHKICLTEKTLAGYVFILNEIKVRIAKSWLIELSSSTTKSIPKYFVIQGNLYISMKY